MATISEQSFYVWDDVGFSSDLSKFTSIIRNVPDEELIMALEMERGSSGVNKYPIRAVWNSILLFAILGLRSVEDLRRELKINPTLCHICGFNAFLGSKVVPSAGCYSRFFKKLYRHLDLVTKIFKSLKGIITEQIPDYGKDLAADGKALSSFGNRPGSIKDDLRGDHEADWGKHTTRWSTPDGKSGEKVKSWFGYVLHLIADTTYELPVAFTILPASVSEKPAAKCLINVMAIESPEILERCENFTADRGYDDKAMFAKLYEHDINPIIDNRMLWKDTDTDPTRAYEKYDGVVYDQKGHVYCISPEFGDQKEMTNQGFDRSRNALKFGCPAEKLGITCRDRECCKIPKSIRIPLDHDTRIFTSVSRSSYKWKRLYNARSAIERVNSRIDNVFGFENHTIRGQKKMTLRITLSFIVMLSFAVGKIQESRESEMRQFKSA